MKRGELLVVKEEITKRHYFTEEEVKQLLQLPEGCVIERIEQPTDFDKKETHDLKDFICIVTTLENINLNE